MAAARSPDTVARPAAPVAKTAAPAPVVTPPQDATCEYLPDFLCNPHKYEMAGAGDIPLWVWGLLGAGATGFVVLAYASFKAAPYVMPLVNPEHAPIAKAWLRARAGHDKYEIAHEALTALREQRARTTPRTKEELQILREEALKEAFAEMLARRRKLTKST
jgi:hypothetical protein